MKIAVLGTGMVGNAIATKLVNMGHQIMMGSRTANSDAGQEWFVPSAAKHKLARSRTPRPSVKSCSTAPTARIRSSRYVWRGRTICAARFSFTLPIRWTPPKDAANADHLQHRFTRRTGERKFPDVRVVKALNTVNATS